MKKLIFSALAIFAFSFAQAQDGNAGQTAQGKWLIEANTGFGEPGNTGFYLRNRDGETQWNIGLEGGYFVIDDLALKVGLGYGDQGGDDGPSVFSYKLGAKYYILSMIPVQLDFTGLSIEDVDENPTYLGIQAGYAWFLGDNVSIEPGLRYNATLNEDADAEGNLQFNIGFALHF